MTASNVIDVTAATFAREVIEASRTQPVLVDFWAPWCGPCRGLAPILERLAGEMNGRFRLAKLNTDEEAEIAARYGIRSIPNVKAFVDGAVVDEFTGALPERAVREFLDRLLPGPLEKARREARALTASGAFGDAETRLRGALAEAAGERPAIVDGARLDLAELLLARQDYAAGEAILELVTAPVAAAEDAERLAAARARVHTWRNAATLPEIPELEARLAAGPTGREALELRMQLAERLTAAMRFEPALEALLGVIRGARGAENREFRERAREAMLRIFKLAANESGDSGLVSRYRRLLAAELN